jgi:hypothetical protein
MKPLVYSGCLPEAMLHSRKAACVKICGSFTEFDGGFE